MSKVGSCGNVFRFILGAINLFFILLGISIVVLTSVFRWSSWLDSYKNENIIKIIDPYIIIILVIGILLILLNIFGFIAIISLNRILLIIYEIIIVIIFLIFVGSFIALLLLSPKLEEFINNEFNSSITNINNGVYKEYPIYLILSKVLDCCGADGQTDFNNSTIKNEYCEFKNGAYSKNGCRITVIDILKNSRNYFIVIPGSVIIFIFLLLIFFIAYLIYKASK